MIPSAIPNPVTDEITERTFCELAERWGVSERLIWALIGARAELPFDIWIFSGARSRSEQSAVSSTPFDLSTHANTDAHGCPRLATGVDVQPVSPAVRLSLSAVAQLGAALTRRGLRWGGGAPVTPEGIPEGNERWHFDLGSRSE